MRKWGNRNHTNTHDSSRKWNKLGLLRKTKQTNWSQKLFQRLLHPPACLADVWFSPETPLPLWRFPRLQPLVQLCAQRRKVSESRVPFCPFQATSPFQNTPLVAWLLAHLGKWDTDPSQTHHTREFAAEIFLLQNAVNKDVKWWRRVRWDAWTVVEVGTLLKKYHPSTTQNHSHWGSGVIESNITSIKI